MFRQTLIINFLESPSKFFDKVFDAGLHIQRSFDQVFDGKL
jgi:hypothetical protein